MRLMPIAATLAITAASSSLAFADDDPRCGNVAADAWLSVEQIAQKAVQAGYQVRQVERDDGCYDVDVTDAQGRETDLRMHPRTGEVIEVDIDD